MLSSKTDRRMEAMLSRKLNRKQKERLPEVEALGHVMIEVAEELGESSAYGVLLKASTVQFPD